LEKEIAKNKINEQEVILNGKINSLQEYTEYIEAILSEIQSLEKEKEALEMYKETNITYKKTADEIHKQIKELKEKRESEEENYLIKISQQKTELEALEKELRNKKAN